MPPTCCKRRVLENSRTVGFLSKTGNQELCIILKSIFYYEKRKRALRIAALGISIHYI